jgi:hypothetical protein
MRGDRSFFWYCWNRWPSLFILSFHNMALEQTQKWVRVKQDNGSQTFRIVIVVDNQTIKVMRTKQIRAWVPQWVRYLDCLTTHTSLSPIWRGFVPGLVNYKKGCTRLAAASDKVYQLLAHGWWFSPGTLASSTTKTGHYDIAEILLKVVLKHPKNQPNI